MESPLFEFGFQCGSTVGKYCLLLASSSSTEGEVALSGSNIGVLLPSVGISVVLRVSLGGESDSSATSWSVVDDLWCLLHCLWDDLSWEVEVLYTFVGEDPVEVSPGELLLEVASGSQRLASLDDVEVWDILDVIVHASSVSLADLLGDHNAILEKSGVDLVSDFPVHKHGGRVFL